MSIPEFPDSRALGLEDKPEFDRLFAAMQPELSQYTFANLFAWRKARATRVSALSGQTIVFFALADRRILLEPLGDGPTRETMEACLDSAGPGAAEFRYLGWNSAALFQGAADFRIEQDRDNSDYLYRTERLVELAGHDYDAKRGIAKRFKNYRYIELTPENAAVCSCRGEEGPGCEASALRELLDNFGALGLRGGALEVEGVIVGLALGEALNRSTLVVHVEQADARLAGSRAALNREFCRREAGRFEYVNLGPDMGLPGRRQEGLSYHPERLVEAWRVSRTRVVVRSA